MTLSEFQTLIIYTISFAVLFGVLFSLLLAFFGQRK